MHSSPVNHPAWAGVGLTDRGLLRHTNQDAFAVLNHLNLWIVADGMGGHPAGDVASRIAVDYIARQAEQEAALLGDGGDSIESLLVGFLHSAHHAILDQGALSNKLHGMGTTIVLVHIATKPQPQAVVAHLGDSRAYLVRGNTLTQLTQDHTLVEIYLRERILTPEQAMTHPDRHVLTRALGIGDQIAPEVRTCPLEHGDTVLLCTDGLTKMLDDSRITATLQRAGRDPSRACRMLVDEAVRLGGEDNVTVVVCRNTFSAHRETKH